MEFVGVDKFIRPITGISFLQYIQVRPVSYYYNVIRFSFSIKAFLGSK